MNKRLSQIFAASAFALASVPALTRQAYAEGGGGNSYGWDWGWSHMMGGSLMMVLFWGLVVLLVVLIVRAIGSGSNKKTATASNYSALEILHERFARGDIEKDEFENRKRILSN